MSMHIIELNDRNVRLSEEEGKVLAESPGFANVAPKTPVFGEEARQLFRLYPRQSFNQFWSQLSLDPLTNTNPHFRHQADLAFSHLSSLCQTCPQGSEVIFVVPGNYNRQQLAVLLGLAKQSPLKAVGLVDMAVLAACAAADSENAIYLDIQLHQAVISSLSNKNGMLKRESVLQLPGAGSLALYDAWASMIADAFIRQSRFDPRHNAETEQYIYSQLPLWLAQSLGGNDILMEINNKGTIHQARLNRNHFEQRATNILTRIQAEIKTLTSPHTGMFTSAEAALLPGIQAFLPNITVLPDNAVIENGLFALDHIVREGEQALSFITSLPGGRNPTPLTSSRTTQPGPSHILINHLAYPLTGQILYLGKNTKANISTHDISFIEIPEPGLEGLLTITRQAEDYVLEKPEGEVLQINGETLAERRTLRLGDQITLPNASVSMHLIRVN
ncbi:MAG: hypothetical protein RQ899_11125 [Pseudomonadales bacterium]|nr:hypothetical protein [Pseudomonadales bacterium]